MQKTGERWRQEDKEFGDFGGSPAAIEAWEKTKAIAEALTALQNHLLHVHQHIDV
jgi:hypothetical protein